MRRIRVTKAAAGVSLFPFLAVLICTMGALIVLLMLVVQMARVDASDEALERVLVTPPDEAGMEQASSQWRRELWEQQLQQLQEDVVDHRLELSHLEQHIRELQQRWTSLQAEAADIHLRLRGDAADEQTIAESLRWKQAELDQIQRELEEARSAAATQPPRYSIVPYEGPHGTRRQPIYLECTSQGVLIQPEGVLLTQADFGGLMGPGNPLDAALRAIREFRQRSSPAGGSGEPYPLLIVRPGGAESYALARSALRAWDDEFGYELVEATVQLDYPAAHEQLAELLRKTIRDARSRQAALAAAMPSRFPQQEEVGVVASTEQGGFVPLAGGDLGGLPTRHGGFGTGGDLAYQTGRPANGPAPDPTAADPAEFEPPLAGQSRRAGRTEGNPGERAGSGVAPLAHARGPNWGLPGETHGATGITRPLRMACLTDRLILLPEQGSSQMPEIVMIDSDLREGVDTLVAKIWDRIDLWGMAVAGGYWKPVLVVDIAQGAEQRFHELQTLLQGSGLEIRRRSP